jgi:prepilin-type N-terminal cleavage/methylation domain-containing protein
LSASSCRTPHPKGGFTLIEVVGALLIFSVGVLMVIQVSSEIVVLTNERLDSLEAAPLASISAGTVADTVSVRGLSYERLVTVTSITAVLARIDVSIAPVEGAGPSHAVTSYTSAAW